MKSRSLNDQKSIDRFKEGYYLICSLNDFKGFDFNVGEKKFRYGVNNQNGR
jgi:hypothetical protein